MAGLEERLKSPESLAAKLLRDAGDDGDLVAASQNVSDGLRYTGLWEPAAYTSAVRAVIDTLEAAGYAVRVKNTWLSTVNPYRGINVALTTAEGVAVELQLHTPASFEVKMGEQHDLYRELQNGVADPARNREILDRMWALVEALEIPPGAGTIS
jgi:hypothetical protein